MRKQKHLFILYKINVSVFRSKLCACVVVIFLDLRQISPIVLSQTPRMLFQLSGSTDWGQMLFQMKIRLYISDVTAQRSDSLVFMPALLYVTSIRIVHTTILVDWFICTKVYFNGAFNRLWNQHGRCKFLAPATAYFPIPYFYEIPIPSENRIRHT